ncbi:WhiB family transcriptional regulator [Catenulispora yoronensis]
MAGACRMPRHERVRFLLAAHERGSARQRRVERAREICRTCPVKEPCAAFAVATRQAHGVWGGMSEHDRRS